MIRRELALASLLLFAAIVAAACSYGPSSASSATTASAAGASDPRSAQITKGAWLYVEYACVQCHGTGGRGRGLITASGPSLVSTEFKKAFPRQPDFDIAIINMVRNGSIIEDDRAASMPAWNGILSDEEIQSIVAYIRAGLPDMSVPLPPTRTGDELYRAFACVKCHGEIGKGGIRNIAASTPEHKIIPAIGGPAFRAKFGSIDEVRNIILHGRLVEGGRPGVVYMPAWGKIGTADQMETIIRYIWDISEPKR